MKITKNKKTFLIEFTDQDIAILGDSLIEPFDWFETAFSEKLANCKSRLIERETKKILANKSVASIPTDEAVLLELIFGQADYKNRKKRDEEELKIK